MHIKTKKEIEKERKLAQKEQIQEAMSAAWTTQIIEYFRNPLQFWDKYKGDDMVTPSHMAKPVPKQGDWKDISFFSKSD